MTDSTDTTDSTTDNTVKTIKPRSLIRRLVPITLALMLLVGGGWGVYSYTTAADAPDAPDAHLTASDGEKAKNSSAADELKYLLTSKSMPSAKTAASVGTTSQGDRYRLTPATDKPTVGGLSSTSRQNPFAGAPPVAESNVATKPKPAASVSVSDRYASPPSSDTTPLLPPAKSQPDVTRGQEPAGFNPLRTAADSLVATSPALSPPEEQARAAFRNDLQATPPARLAPTQTAAIGNAQPLQPTTPTANGRYQSASLTGSLPSNRPAGAEPTLSDPPAPDLGVGDLGVSPRKSAGASNLGLPSEHSSDAHPSKLAAQGGTEQTPSNPYANSVQPQEFGSREAAPQRSVLPPQSPMKTARLAPRNLPAGDPLLNAEPLPKNHALGQNPAGLDLTDSGTPTPGLTSTQGTGRPGERLLEGAQSPSITVQKLAPSEIQVGRKCTFAIRVQNTGQRTAQNVQIRDEVPLGTQLLGTVPRASVSGTNILWDLGTLSVGEERTVEMELLPTEEGELGSVATVVFAAQASAKARCTRPQLALRLSSSKPKVLVGDQHLIQIEITNPGSGDATGVMLMESVPPGVSHAAGPALELEIGTLRAGQSRRMELVLTAEQAGQIENVMTARADANLRVEASCQFEVIAPLLQVSVEGPQRRYLERPATYHVSVANPGSASAKDVQLVTHLPKGLQFVKANNMGEYNATTHSIHWSLPELPANERGTVELVALPIEAGEQTLQITTKSRQGLEDRIEKSVLVEGLAAMMFEVIDVEDPIEIGGETTYEIRVVNQGSKAAVNLQVVAIMPPGIRPLSAQGETRHTIQGERVIFAPLAQLSPKADVTYRVHAQGLRAGDQRVRVQITTDDMQQPITKEESTRVYSDQ